MTHETFRKLIRDLKDYEATLKGPSRVRTRNAMQRADAARIAYLNGTPGKAYGLIQGARATLFSDAETRNDADGYGYAHDAAFIAGLLSPMTRATPPSMLEAFRRERTVARIHTIPPYRANAALDAVSALRAYARAVPHVGYDAAYDPFEIADAAAPRAVSALNLGMHTDAGRDALNDAVSYLNRYA